jgi:hypothetical protein
MDVFVAELDGEPRPGAEIAALAWYRPGQAFAGSLAPAIHALADVWTRS